MVNIYQQGAVLGKKGTGVTEYIPQEGLVRNSKSTYDNSPSSVGGFLHHFICELLWIYHLQLNNQN